ncbi:aminoglycoside phosphotransferase family protein [Streptosporangiaceae bacterium NEAU-GS5]|nr:aminoglycoside phosphotransferase family protein [Streptosporangiaceae bacterium NEAU-GS5]
MTALVTCGDGYLGEIGPFDVPVPWWPEVELICAHLESVLGGPVVVLRLLRAEGGESPRGGHVTYHAEFLGERAGGPIPKELAEGHPRRSAWATAQGVRDALDWTDAALSTAGRPRTGPAIQVKTWNLAGLWRIPTAGGPVWLKITSAFASDEGSVIQAFAAVDPTLVPVIVAVDPANHRVLMEQVPGEDCWSAPAEVIGDTVARFAAAQTAVVAPAGLRRRAPKDLAGEVAALLDGEAGRQLSADELRDAWDLVSGLPALVADLDACGLPETVVHGDFHTGNWRAEAGKPAVALDFADACLGHPVVDGLRPRLMMPVERWAETTRPWVEAWRRLVPGSDPAHALTLGEPIQHLTCAVVYQEFLDGIEPSERVYHEGDPASVIRAAVSTRP